MFALTSQLRRAALSVPTNIVQGFARGGNSEFRHFVVIALGSLAEVKYLISVAYRLKYLQSPDHELTLQLSEETGKLLWKFYKSFK